MKAFPVILVLFFSIALPATSSLFHIGKNSIFQVNEVKSTPSSLQALQSVDKRETKDISESWFSLKHLLARKNIPLEELKPDAKKLRNNWDINQDKVARLKKYSTDLEECQEELKRQLNWLLKQKEKNKIYFQELPEAIKRLEQSEKEIKKLKTFKLLQLGNPDASSNMLDIIFGAPKDLKTLSKKLKGSSKDLTGSLEYLMKDDEIQFSPFIEGIEESIVEKLSLSIFEGITKIVTKFNILFEDDDLKEKFDTLSAWKYVFKTLDFLVENEFISDQATRSIFHDEETVVQFVNYVLKTLKKIHGQFAFWNNMKKLTENWYWPHLNNFVQVLKKEEENVINFVFLVKRLANSTGTIQRTKKLVEKIEAFDRSFSCQKYINKLISSHQSNHSRIRNQPTNFPVSMRHPELDEDDIQDLINKLVIKHPLNELIEIPWNYAQNILMFNVVNLFVFIEDELYSNINRLLDLPEFLKLLYMSLGYQGSQNIAKPKHLFELVKQTARYYNVHGEADRYDRFKSCQYALDIPWETAIYKELLDEMDDALGKYTERFLEIQAKETINLDTDYSYKFFALGNMNQLKEIKKSLMRLKLKLGQSKEPHVSRRII